MRTGIIYKFVFPNEKIYIGQTIQTIEERVRQHKKDSLSKDYKICRAIRKYKDFEVFILHKDIAIDLLNELEIREIANHNSLYNGYNSTLGGFGASGFKHTEVSKKKISKPGYKNPSSRLNKDDVSYIRRMFNINNISIIVLSKKFNVNYSTIYNVVMNKSYYDKLYNPPKTTCKITKDDKNAIVKKYLEKYTQKELAKLYNITVRRVGAILKEYNVDCSDNNITANKITFNIAEKIRYEFISGTKIKHLSVKYKLCVSSIYNILSHRVWK